MSQREGNELLAEAVIYFQARPGLGRLLAGFVEKYRRLGRLGGKVILDHVSPEEKTELETFFRKRLPAGSLGISSQMFQQALAETRFGGLDPVEILRLWNGGLLTSRRHEREQLLHARQEMMAKFLAEHSHSFCQAWLKAALAGEPGTRRLQAVFNHDARSMDHAAVALRALSRLPAEYKRLPVFARRYAAIPMVLILTARPGSSFWRACGMSEARAEGNRKPALLKDCLPSKKSLNCFIDSVCCGMTS